MPPASGSTNNTSNAAVQAAAKAEREEKLRGALKTFILKERQRKKEEIEAKIEEERLRKEREARDRQNDMTLEETRGQIVKLEQKLTDLHNQKQQLFLQLKRVLHEDEVRKKQQKDNEVLAIQTLQAQQVNVPQPQVFLPPVRMQHHQMTILTKPVNNTTIKRGRSPSPTQGYYKPANYPPIKREDGRRNADYARVLWNKPHTTYQSPGTLFYQTTSNAPPPPPPQQAPPEARGPAVIYTPYNLPMRQGYHLEIPPTSNVTAAKPEVQTQKPAQVYHINLDQPPPISHTGGGGGGAVGSGVPASQKPQITMEKINERYHVEIKHETPAGHPGPSPPHQLPEGVVYTPIMPGMPLHTNVMQLGGGPSPTNSKASNNLTGQTYAATPRGQTLEPQLVRQQQLTVIPSQPGQHQQPIHYPRRMY